MKGELFINGKDAFLTFGASLAYGALETLQTPPPLKAPIENKGRGAHGKQVLYPQGGLKHDERIFTLELVVQASSSALLSQYINALRGEFSGALARISTKQSADVYKCVLLSFTNFSISPSGKVAKVALSLNEPNPQNRR